MLILLIVLFCIDQLTKYLARTYLIKRKRKKFYQLQLVKNKGAALGFLKNHPKALMVINALVMLIVSYMLYDGIQLQAPKLYINGLGLIITGGIGNITDRLTLGYVTDFLKPGHKKMPYFNMADFYILFGVLMLFVSEFFL
jgi:signal peptidase II